MSKNDGEALLLRPRSLRRALPWSRERRRIEADGDELVVTSVRGRVVRFPRAGQDAVRSIGFRLDATRPSGPARRSPVHLVLLAENEEVVASGACYLVEDDYEWSTAEVRAFASAAGLDYTVLAAGPRSNDVQLPPITSRSFDIGRPGLPSALRYTVTVATPVVLLALVLWLLPAWVAVGLGAAVVSGVVTALKIQRGSRRG